MVISTGNTGGFQGYNSNIFGVRPENWGSFFVQTFTAPKKGRVFVRRKRTGHESLDSQHLFPTENDDI